MEYHLVDFVAGNRSAAVCGVAPTKRRASHLLVGSPNDVTCDRCLATEAYGLADVIWNDRWDVDNPEHEEIAYRAAAHPEWLEFMIAADVSIG